LARGSYTDSGNIFVLCCGSFWKHSSALLSTRRLIFGGLCNETISINDGTGTRFLASFLNFLFNSSRQFYWLHG